MRTHGTKSLRDLSIALAVFLTITGCGYNKLQGLDEAGQRRVGRSAKSISEACRSRPEL